MEADEAVRKTGLALGYDRLKVEQIAALCALVGGRYVFVSRYPQGMERVCARHASATGVRQLEIRTLSQ